MNLSAPFIARPVATTLLTAALGLVGAVAFTLLPVSPLPQVDFPTITVKAALPGASPETMAATVATPLGRALGRIAGVTELTSRSIQGETRVTLQFELDRDIDGAARDVQGAINATRGLLPTGLPHQPTYRKVNPSDAPILILALTSNTMTRGDMYDVASTVLAQKLSQLKGVGEVAVGGSALPAVRVELDPATLYKYGISFEAVRGAILATNSNRPKGALEAGERRWQIDANDQAQKAQDYLPLIVAYRNGAAVRLSDVASVVDSVQDIRNAGVSNGRPAVLMVIMREPGANIIETVERVKALLPHMRASIPAAIDLQLAMDRTMTVRSSLREVELTLVVSVALVIMVVFLFLKNARAATIPSVAVPVSLVATFAVMYLCGFSLNNLSLMALAIAAGFVVDDTIVVLENVSRHIEAGVQPVQAALRGAREVGFTVLAMSLSLIAVFVPILFMDGMVGRLFREFAVTLAVAVVVSLMVSLTTTPMMCARLLRRSAQGRDTERRADGRFFSVIRAAYAATLGWSLRHRRVVMLLLLATIGLNVYLYLIVPKGFFPSQDTGRLSGRIRTDESISFQAMQRKLDRFVEIVKQDPAVETVTGLTGGGLRNRASLYIALKPLQERGASSKEVIRRLRAAVAREPGARLYLKADEDLHAGARESNSQYQFTLRADEMAELREWEPRVRQALSELAEIDGVSSDQQDRARQIRLVIDRDAAARLGVTASMVDATFNNAFGQRQISVIYNAVNQYRVVMEVAPEHAQGPEALSGVQVVTPNGSLVPLSAFARYEPETADLSAHHHGEFPSSTISFDLAPGVALSDAMQAIRRALNDIRAPASIHGSFEGTARVFQSTLDSQPWLILAALLSMYIVLGMLYESCAHPLTIMSTLPPAGVGAILALLVCGEEFTIMALIAVILLIGIVMKNAIMMIDVALEEQRGHGRSPEDAIRHACLLRFRPIMMTTLAALLSAVPLAIGTGEGAELRRPLGIAIVGGLAVSQLLTLYTTPVVYLYLNRFGLWCRRLAGGRVPAEGLAGGTP